MAVEFYNFFYSSVSQPAEIANSGIYLQPGEEVLLEKSINHDGILYTLIIQIPSGVNGDALFQISVNSKQIFPSEGWFTGNGTVLQIPIYEEVKRGDKLYVRAINRGSQPHFIYVQIGQIIQS